MAEKRRIKKQEGHRMSEDMDNLNTQQDVDNGQAQPETNEQNATFNWKAHLSADIKNSPTLQKFEDTPEGLGKAFTSHLSLEKMLGNEKIPIPKGEDDTEGWARYNKAFGIPDTAEGYKLEDFTPPEGFNSPIDKKSFMEVAHKYRATPTQAQGMWKEYNDMVFGKYNELMGKYTTQLNETKTALRKEWGDAYDSNVELGQFVINKFGGNEDDKTFLTSQMVQDPRMIKLMATIGKQFSENKIGDFKYRQFSKSPDEALAEIESITRNKEHPYNNKNATEKEHQMAVDYVNQLYAVAANKRT